VYWRRLVPDEQVQHSRLLGVEIDENVSWNKHIENVVKKVTSGIGVMRKICDLLFIML
jgi:hypothetical protein